MAACRTEQLLGIKRWMSCGHVALLLWEHPGWLELSQSSPCWSRGRALEPHCLGENPCSATSWTCNLRGRLPPFHAPVSFSLCLPPRLWRTVNASGYSEKKSVPVHVGGVVGGGNSHCRFHGSCTHDLRDTIAPHVGDGEPQLPRKVKLLALRCHSQWDAGARSGSLDPGSGGSDVPHCFLVLTSISAQMWHKRAPSEACERGSGQMNNLKSKWHSGTAVGHKMNSESVL